MLTDRVALVTGASDGIGRATATALAAEGATVALAARRETKLEVVANEIESTGGNALVVPTDLRDETRIEAMVETTEEAFGRIDVLVNNAGVGHWEALADADAAEWRRELDVNLFGLMYATRLAVPGMLEREAGHVVNVSSISGRHPGPGEPGYVASKFGVTGFSESILWDLREKGLRVTLVEPGRVATAMQPEEDLRTKPMLNPEAVADAIVYAVTRPGNVCVNQIQLLATRTP